MPPAARIDELRERVSRLERRTAAQARGVVRLRVPEIDNALPGGGLALGALHEVAGTGPEVEHGAAATLFIAALLARTRGPVLWVLAQPDLFAPALAGIGLSPRRVLHVEAGSEVLAAMEEGLRHRGLAGVVGEVSGRLGLTASRRLHLAAEASGALVFALRRSRRFADPALAEPSAAVTRWRVASVPSAPPLYPHPPPLPDPLRPPGRRGGALRTGSSPLPGAERLGEVGAIGLGPARWQLDLIRVRGGEPSSWIVEVEDASGRLALAADLADRPAAPAWTERAAG